MPTRRIAKKPSTSTNLTQAQTVRAEALRLAIAAAAYTSAPGSLVGKGRELMEAAEAIESWLRQAPE